MLRVTFCCLLASISSVISSPVFDLVCFYLVVYKFYLFKIFLNIFTIMYLILNRIFFLFILLSVPNSFWLIGLTRREFNNLTTRLLSILKKSDPLCLQSFFPETLSTSLLKLQLPVWSFSKDLFTVFHISFILFYIFSIILLSLCQSKCFLPSSSLILFFNCDKCMHWFLKSSQFIFKFLHFLIYCPLYILVFWWIISTYYFF